MRKSLIVTVIVAAVIFSIVLLIENIGSLTERETILKAFCDAFFTPGILLTSFGVLTMIAGEGFFDTLNYGIRSLGALFTPIGKRPMKYAEYRAMKAETRKAPQACILRVGIICLLASFVCLGMYYL